MARRRTNDAKIDPALFRRGASSVTLSEDVIAAYLSILREEGRTGQSLRLCETVLRQFLAFLPDGVITKDSLPAWREQLLSEGFAIRTVNCRVSTVSALLEAMEEYHVTVDGQTYPLPEPFVVLATQNPVGSAGTQLLPAAQLDRFLIRTSMGYPDAKSQIDILKERHHENPLDKLTAAVSREQLLGLMNDARQVHISDPVYAYVVELVTATRENEFIELGVSPRGALALCRMAKSCAFVRGRDYVIPEDVAAVFDDVCCHRLVLSAKARLHRLSAADVTAEIVKTVKMPQVQEK